MGTISKQFLSSSSDAKSRNLPIHIVSLDSLVPHPTMKPAKMLADANLDCRLRNDIVLDPFIGSGVTLFAAEWTRRICYGMELESSYVDTIGRCRQTLTAKAAMQNESGRPFIEVLDVAANRRMAPPYAWSGSCFSFCLDARTSVGDEFIFQTFRVVSCPWTRFLIL